MLARDRARQVSDEPLALHYQRRLGEEEGHEVWAERDIQRVSGATVRQINSQIVPAMDGLLGYLAETIDKDPTLYLSYILFAEYSTVLLGAPWLALLEENCGIPRSSMSVIGNHVELDREHVQHALDCIDELVGEPRKLPLMREVLTETLRFFDRFCAEITDESMQSFRMSHSADQQTTAA